MKGCVSMKKDYNRRHYIMKQKAMGLGLILIGILTAIITGGDITVLMLFGAFGLYLVFTKEMWLEDQYYYAVKHSEKMRNSRP